VWDAATGAPIGLPLLHEGRVNSAAFSPDGARVVTASDDKTAQVWELARERPRVTDVILAKDRVGWAVGRAGWAARLEENSSATLVPTQTADDLDAIAEASGGRYIAVGGHGAILVFSMGPVQSLGIGSTVGAIVPLVFHLPPDKLPDGAKQRHLKAIAFRGNDGWISGSDGLMMHSADGGESWSLQSTTTQADIRGVYIQPSENVGWAAARTPQGGWVALRAADASKGPWVEVPQHLAPAWYVAAGLLLPLTLFLNAKAWQPGPATSPSIAAQAAPERPIGWDDPDPLRFKPLAMGLSRFLRNINTEPPLTVAISGRWGSGKSSMMNLLAEDLERHGGRPVRFNAWHHREEEHLLAALFENIRVQAIPPAFTWPGLVFRTRLLIARTRRLRQWLAASALFIAIALFVVRLGAEGVDFSQLVERLGLRQGAKPFGMAAPQIDEKILRL